MFFVVLWLFEIPALLGNFVSIAILIIAALGAVYFIRKDVMLFRWPSRHEIETRIERYSGTKHRPLSTQDDKPINGEENALWQREQRRKQRLLTLLRPAPPRAFLASKDPRALRLGLFMALFCGLLVAGNGWKPRILSGLFPAQFFQGPVIKQDPVTFWINPPEYTGITRIVPAADSAMLEIPQGSILKVIVQQNTTHILRKPSLRIDEQNYAMNRAEDGAHTLEMEIPKGAHLRLQPGLFKNIGWDYTFIPDTPPMIEVQDQPETLPDAQMQFALNMLDDYGVKTLDIRMTLDPVAKNAPVGWPVEEQRSVLSPPATNFQIAPVYNLTAHPWAGLPVVFTFTAHDHLDQIAQSKPLRVVLPERRFTHPVARKLIEVRKYLAWNPENDYSEGALAIEGLLYIPQSYSHDIRVFLALRSAASRLYYNEPSIKTAQSVIALLWDTALRLEDGNLSLAARDLKNIQQALEKALQNPETSDGEISALMNELRQAMAEYMQALAREWQKQAQDQANMPQLPPEVLSQMMNMNDLASLLDKMESDMLSGDRNAAQDMLSKLQRLMDMANPSMSMAMPKDMQMMQDGINELQELVERQEELRAQTAEQSTLFEMMQGLGVKDKTTGMAPFINTEDNKTEQEALRYVLGQLMLEADSALDEIPENLGLAEQAMRGSSEQLGGNRPDLSLPFQDEAIAHLKDSQQQLAQQLVQRMQQMTGFSLGGMPSRMDPLGRPYGGQDGDEGPPFGSKVKVPSEAQKKWVQDIVNELRRRAAQRGRPREELEYYRRLLKRF